MSSPPPTVLSLPYISLQPSLPSVISDILAPQSTVGAEDCWCSCYSLDPKAKEKTKEGTGSVHGRFRVAEGDEEGSVEVREMEGSDVKVEMRNRSEFLVSCPTLSIAPTPALLPSPLLNDAQTPSPYSTNSSSLETPAPSFLTFPVRGGIETFALSGDGKRVVVGGRDGQAKVVEVVKFEGGQEGRKLGKGKETALRGHQGDLTGLEFFPSNEVVLSASSDMSLRVFSATDGSSPRHLLSHTKRVTCLSILRSSSSSGPHKGRLVLSSSLDGTVKLWEVSSSSVLKTWVLSQPVTAMEVFQDGEADVEEVTSGKYALAAHSDGTVSIVDLSSPESSPALVILKTDASSALDSISILPVPHSPGYRAITVGSRSGLVSLFLLPPLPLSPPFTLSPAITWRRTEGSSIRSVLLSPRPATSAAYPNRFGPKAPPHTHARFSVLVALSDGLAYRALVEIELARVSAEVYAPDAERDVKVRVVEEFVGLDCEPATGIREDKEARVWVSGGGGDGGLRIYQRYWG
ncbi:hypothetical protein JCM8547_005696 [Rhodosporidiobolus lusitaniae]